MGIYKKDTSELIARDVASFRAKQIEIKEKLAEALEGYEDTIAHGALSGALMYGWRRPNGYWHPAPGKLNNEIVEGEPPNE